MATRFERARAPRSRDGWPDRTLGDFFTATATDGGDRLALVDGARRLTWAQLSTHVDEVGSGLRGLGVEPGDVVAYQLPNWWEAVVLFLAAARLGAVVNPLLPTFRERELELTLRQSRARILFIPGLFRGCDHNALIASIRHRLPALEHVLTCRAEGDEPALPRGNPGDVSSRAVDPDSILLLMYTSGTTAEPKGVLHTHQTLAAEILSLARVHALGPRDRVLMPSPVTHISGVIHAILTPAILGTSAVLMDRWEPLEALRLIESEGVTYMAGAPTFLQELVRHPRAGAFDTGSLRLFSCGGAAVTPDLVRQARTVFPACVTKRVYGSTEFPTISTTGPEDALTHGIETEGRAIAPAEIRVVGEDGGLCAAGQEGEVQARGPECFVGYADASLDDETFTADGWFRSGDLGTVDERGYLRITGRLKEIVVRKGEKISIRELEDAIAAHPAVAEVAVLAVPDADTGERACAVVVLAADAALSLADLSAFLTARGLSRLKHPERLEIVDALPRTASGKIVRAAVRTQIEGGRGSR